MGTHLAELPPAVTALLDTARAAAAAGDRPRTTKALFEALSAVGFPSTYPDVIYPLPETLTPVQRRLAELIAQMDVFAPWERMPSGATARRWLGLEAPGPLETLVDHEGTRLPLWRVLALGGGRSGVLEVIASLPLPLRLDVLATLGGEAWAYRIDSDAPGAWRVVSSLAGEGRDWALARLAAAPPKALAEVHAEAVIGEQLAFFALVRGGHPIEPAWDLYLPIGTPVPPAIAAECARALPLDRLERVAPTLLEKTFGPVAIQTGLAILAHHDSPAIAQFVWTKSERSFPHHRAAERKALLALAETLPAALAALAPLRGKAPKPRALTVTARLAPRSEAELSTLQAAQLVQAGRAWDRQTLPASRRLSCDENDEAALGAVLEHLTIAEHGKPAFESWLYQGDSGTFFEAGTTNVIAHRIQCAIELVGKKKDPALKDALGRFSESKNASRPLADVRAATLAGLAARKSGPSTAADAVAPVETREHTATKRAATKSTAERSAGKKGR